MKKIKFTAEDLPISECSFDTGRITMRFKNGKTYVFDRNSYLKCVRSQFEYIKGGNIPSRDIENGIQAALAARDASEDDGKRKAPPKRKIMFKLFENKEVQDEQDFADFSAFDDICENAMSIEEEPLEDFQYRTVDALENLTFSQDFLALSRRDPASWVKAKTPDKTYRYMYFYTNGAVENGYEVWHKAYDPVLWAGVAERKKKKE